MKQLRKQAVASIPILTAIACLFHFLFFWTGENQFIALFCPVNESIWEHLKLVFFPLLLWWGCVYFFFRNSLWAEKWMIPISVSSVSAPLFVALFYYGYSGAFGIHALFLDIALMILSLILAQLLAVHGLKYLNINRLARQAMGWCVLLLALMFFVFTFFPPHLPIFQDGPSGTYGIQQINSDSG